MNLATARELKAELRGAIDAAYQGKGGGVRFDGVRFGSNVKFGEKPPRVSLGVAPAPQPGEFRIAVRARSERDLPPGLTDELQRMTAGELDVLFTGPVEVRPAAPGNASPYLAVGASVGHYRCTAGTVGFFAHRVADGAVGLVSNNHILAAGDQGSDRDEVLHPAPVDQGRRPQNVIALLSGNYPRLRGQVAAVDCAFAHLLQGVSFDPRPIGFAQRLASTWIPPELHRDVAKVGRTTKLTYGRVSAFNLELMHIDYAFGPVPFGDHIEIRSAAATPFSRPGDSGSLVFSVPQLHPMGLVFAASSIVTYANPIAAVTSALGVTVIT